MTGIGAIEVRGERERRSVLLASSQSFGGMWDILTNLDGISFGLPSEGRRPWNMQFSVS